MACCGGKRQQFYQGTPNQQSIEPAQSAGPVRAAPRVTVYFEYVGGTGLTAVGPITGKRYRFSHAGAAVAVDARDAPALVAVPHLRPLRNPPQD